MEIAAASLKSLPNVSVLPYSGLTCDFANKNDCGVIVRGMRSPLDFAHESDLAYFSKEQADIETILLLSVRPHISSTLVRELIRLGNKFDAYVIKEAKELIKAAYIQ
jgi:pantetheine-phosphate adenylyltransferase